MNSVCEHISTSLNGTINFLCLEQMYKGSGDKCIFNFKQNHQAAFRVATDIILHSGSDALEFLWTISCQHLESFKI